MDGYYLHISGNTLKVGLYNGAEPGRFLTEDLLPTVCARSRIVDPEEFAKEFKKILAAHCGENLPKLPLFFILEPEVTELFLLTDSKQIINTGREVELMEKQIREKLVDENPEDLYITEYKIAPFIYQFIGVKKAVLEAILKFARSTELELGGIFPVALLLAKTNSEVSSLFVFPEKDKTTAVFSELTGITFAEKLGGKVALEELKQLFWKLSVYNTKNTELKVYSFKKYEHNFSTQETIIFLGQDLEGDYEEISLTRKLLKDNQNLLSGQCNLISIAPTPTMASKSKTPVLAGVGILSSLLIGGLILQLTLGFDTILGNKQARQGQEILSEQEQTQTVMPSPQNTSDQGQDSAKPREIKRSDLIIRVENGNGIPGSAGKMKNYLEELGYKVLSPANADRTDYVKTTIKLPKDFSDYKDTITNDLKTKYSVEVVNLETRMPDYDVLIIVGRE